MFDSLKATFGFGPTVGVPGVTQEGRKAVTMDRRFSQAVENTARMAENGHCSRLARRFGLDIVNVAWEDTARYKNSCVGPNISDVTIQVFDRSEAWCMPVIRHPNFSDRTCDLDPRDFTLLVGNHTGEELKRISLYEFLEDPTKYLSKPESWQAPIRSLLAERDRKVLVSAQACLLPVPREGKATFNPVLFNYQSEKGRPAVLTILATREGTSVTIIDNQRDAFQGGSSWGQRLFHNVNGERASLTGERLSDYKAQRDLPPPPSVPGNEDGMGLSLVLVIQVPLKQPPRPERFRNEISDMIACARVCQSRDGADDEPDFEAAVIGHGDLEGPFTEIDGLAIERDPDFPIRVTVQFYKAVSEGKLARHDLNAIRADIDRVYRSSDSVGSLVTQGETGRITEYAGAKVEPPEWWREFWRRHQANTGDRPEVAMLKLRRLLGENYETRPVTGLYLHDLLRK